jgi:hypothetical protein
MPGNLKVDHCSFEGNGASGIIAYGFGKETQSSIQVTANAFNNCWTAWQMNGIVWDPNISFVDNQVTGDTVTLRHDQISLYESSGSLAGNIIIKGNFLQGSPDAPVASDTAGGIVLDYGADYASVVNNIVINDSIGSDSGPLTKVIMGNTVIGIGVPTVWQFGIAVVPNSAYVVGNTVGFWDTRFHNMNNYYVEQGPQSAIDLNANVSLSHKDITLAQQQALYWRWTNEMVAEHVWPVGCPGDLPTVHYPTDFLN